MRKLRPREAQKKGIQRDLCVMDKTTSHCCSSLPRAQIPLPLPSCTFHTHTPSCRNFKKNPSGPVSPLQIGNCEVKQLLARVEQEVRSGCLLCQSCPLPAHLLCLQLWVCLSIRASSAQARMPGKAESHHLDMMLSLALSLACSLSLSLAFYLFLSFSISFSLPLPII